MLPLHLLPPQLQPHHRPSSGRFEGVRVLVQSGSTQAWHREPRRSASSACCWRSCAFVPSGTHGLVDWEAFFIIHSQPTAGVSHTCLIAISPTLSECFLMLSRKSLRSDKEISLISSRNLGRFSAIIWQNLYWLTLRTEPQRSTGSCTEMTRQSFKSPVDSLLDPHKL